MRIALSIFRALADPTRLRILGLLRAMELSVGELAQVLGQSQPRVSRHVKILADAGLAVRRKEGSWVFLGLGAKSRSAPVLDAIDAWANEEPGDHWAVADIARLAAVRADRAAAAEAYFEARAAEWDAIRSLYAPESAVEDAIIALLEGTDIGALVDLGTGTGRMLELLGKQAVSAVGIDRSPEMLRLARAKLAAAGMKGAELRQGDIYAIPLDSGGADTVLLHQVLHYAQQPAAAINEAARLLGPGGRLLVVDFAPHEREELRISDAHARLGFDDDQMCGWFENAGLDLEKVRELKGGALTVKFWLGRRAASSAKKELAA